MKHFSRLALIVGAMLAIALPSSAQTRTPLPIHPPHVTGNVPADIAADQADLKANVAAHNVRTTATAASTAQTNPILVLQSFTVADLQAADADAKAQSPPDTIASNCYEALIPIVQSNIANPFPTGLGGFQLLQKSRDALAIVANIQSPTGPLASLNVACAPLVMSVQNTLIQLGVLGGAAAIKIP